MFNHQNHLYIAVAGNPAFSWNVFIACQVS